MSKIQALVADDEKTTRFILRQILEREGCSVIEAADGAQAVAAFEAMPPDIVLLDCMMPVMDGFSACAKIRSLPQGDHVPILMITALADEASIDKAYQAGATDYITKPVRPEMFRRRVQNTLRAKLMENALIRGKREWEATFDSVSDPILLTDIQGKVIRCNQAAIRHFEATYIDLLGQDIETLLPGNAKKATVPFFGQTNEKRLLLKGRWLETHVYPMHLEGNLHGKVYIVKDVTERKQMETALRESESRHRNLFENSPISLWEEDFSAVKRRLDDLRRDGVADFGMFFKQHPEVAIECMNSVRITDVNKATLKLYGAASKEELLGHLSAIFSKDSYETFYAELMAIAEGCTQFDGEGINCSLQGERLDVNVRWMVAPGHEADFSRVLVSVVDLTESKKMQSQMMEAQKLADIGTLAAGVAHEINSPLQVITGMSDSALRRLDQTLAEPEALRRQLETIKRNAWRCAEIVRALLTYSHPRATQTAPNDFNRLIRDGLLLIEHQLRSWSNITITAELEPNLPPLVCDPNQITQVLINLLTNARDAMPHGGEIAIRTTHDARVGRLCLQVSDNGLGIPDAVRSRIFDPFYTTKSLGKGTGLGLSIVAGIVRAHRGAIEVQSQVGRGATFSLYFPIGNEAGAALTIESLAHNHGRFDDSLNLISEAGGPVGAPAHLLEVNHA